MGVPKNDDGVPLNAEAMRTGSELILPTHNFCDPTTWYTESVRVENVALTDSGDGLTWTSAHPNWIDLTHGRIFDETALCGDVTHGYAIIVKSDGATLTERAPFSTSGGDYTVDYASGSVTFASSQAGKDVRAWYSRANGSMFALVPLNGRRVDIEKVKAQFSIDVEMNDSVVFEVWAYNPYDLPNKVKVDETIYKTLENFIEESFDLDPVVPVVGGALRGVTSPIHTFKFAYRTIRSVRSSQGVELRVKLGSDTPFGGTRGTATFFCTVHDDVG
jgi:hypothetical protein